MCVCVCLSEGVFISVFQKCCRFIMNGSTHVTLLNFMWFLGNGIFFNISMVIQNILNSVALAVQLEINL